MKLSLDNYESNDLMWSDLTIEHYSFAFIHEYDNEKVLKNKKQVNGIRLNHQKAMLLKKSLDSYFERLERQGVEIKK